MLKGYQDAGISLGLLEHIPSEALRQASLDIVENWPRGPGEPDVAAICSELVRLSQTLQCIKKGDRPVTSDFDPDLLNLVRAQLLERRHGSAAGPDLTAEDIAALEVLRADATFAVLGEARELLKRPDGFQLVVEMAHDLRSPLSSILFLSDTLRRGQSGETTELQRKQLGLIYAAAFGLAAVVNDVMELAKGGATPRDESEQLFSVVETVNSVIELVAPIAEEKGLELRSDVKGLDQVRGYPISTSRALLNLTANAIQHTSEGHVAVTVWRHDRSCLEFSIQDTGEGIEASAMDGLFKPFRAEGCGGRMLFSGTGLGLSIAQGLVEAAGGELGFDTEPGKGTRFWFRVPVSAT